MVSRGFFLRGLHPGDIATEKWEVSDMTIEEMKNVDVRTVDPETLVDVKTITIETSLPKEERIKEYIRKVKNPVCFRVGDVVVKCSYSNDGVTIRDRFEQLVRTL